MGSAVAPAERVRRRVAELAGETVARALPAGYERLGRVLIVRLPEELRPFFVVIGQAWLTELGVATVLRRAGPVVGDWRAPGVERIAGNGPETEVVENGVRYRFDAGRVMFARGNKEERRRAGTVTRPHENVVDLFAGIGYFSIPAARLGRAARVLAVEQNPLAYDYLVQNVALNRVEDVVVPRLGDNREVELPPGEADRIFLGYLPSAVAWVPRALTLLRPAGGILHVHLVIGTRGGGPEAEDAVTRAVVEADGRVEAVSHREVKPYGPGRSHHVVDVRARPGSARP
jgi:tRNA wybutosine-synthesizing protein 2